MPESLKDQGISVGEVKNQYIFMASPRIQLAKRERRIPLQDRERALVISCGMGSVASTDKPM